MLCDVAGRICSFDLSRARFVACMRTHMRALVRGEVWVPVIEAAFTPHVKVFSILFDNRPDLLDYIPYNNRPWTSGHSSTFWRRQTTYSTSSQLATNPQDAFSSRRLDSLRRLGGLGRQSPHHLHQIRSLETPLLRQKRRLQFQRPLHIRNRVRRQLLSLGWPCPRARRRYQRRNSPSLE